jgi:hypothetical protein
MLGGDHFSLVSGDSQHLIEEELVLFTALV